jgi:hypothetical protein
MSIFVVICYAVAAILGFLAAFYNPPSPPPANLVSLAVAFIALGLLLQSLGGVTG